MKIRVSSFGGLRPRVAPHMLSGSDAQEAVNCKLLSGALRPWGLANVDTVHSNLTAVQSLFYYQDKWLYWDADVDVVRTPLANDTHERIYLTGSAAKPQYAVKTDVGADGFGRPTLTTRNLGVPAPTSTPAVSPSGGSGDTVDRTYVYTFVSPHGEEGPPSDPSPLTSGSIDATWQLTGMDAAAPAWYTHLTLMRIYRSVPSGTTTKYQFVAEQAIGATYNDTVTDVGEELPSLNWSPPRDDMIGIISLPGGILVGFVGNIICFSEPGYPHAWPRGYELTTNDAIVGLGSIGTTVVVLTEAYPYLIYCPDPAQADPDKLDDILPCTSKQGIVSMEAGVLYPSQEGLVLIGPGVATVITKDLLRRSEWQGYSPSTIRGHWTNGRYIGFYNSEGGFVFEPGESGEFTELGFYASAGVVKEDEDQLYYGFAQAGDYHIAKWEGATSGTMWADWKSKRFITPRPVNFGHARVTADYPEGGTDPDDLWDVINANEAAQLTRIGEGVLGGTVIGALPLGGDVMDQLENQYEAKEYITFRLFANGELKHEDNLTNDDPIPLPAGYTAREWEIEVVTNVEVREIAVAESVAELTE